MLYKMFPEHIPIRQAVCPQNREMWKYRPDGAGSRILVFADLRPNNSFNHFNLKSKVVENF